MSANGEKYKAVLQIAAKYAQSWLDSIPTRDVNPSKSANEVGIEFGSELPNGPTDPSAVDEKLATSGEAGLISARQKVLTDVGWDLDRLGLNRAPPIRVFVGEERHDSVDRSLRYLGLGGPIEVDVDEQDRISVQALKRALEIGSAHGSGALRN